MRFLAVLPLLSLTVPALSASALSPDTGPISLPERDGAPLVVLAYDLAVAMSDAVSPEWSIVLIEDDYQSHYLRPDHVDIRGRPAGGVLTFVSPEITVSVPAYQGTLSGALEHLVTRGAPISWEFHPERNAVWIGKLTLSRRPDWPLGRRFADVGAMHVSRSTLTATLSEDFGLQSNRHSIPLREPQGPALDLASGPHGRIRVRDVVLALLADADDPPILMQVLPHWRGRPGNFVTGEDGALIWRVQRLGWGNIDHIKWCLGIED